MEFSVGGKQQQFWGVLGEERRAELVVGLEGQSGEIGDVALQRPDPALVGDDDGDRLALDERFLDRGKVVLGGISELGAALAKRRLRPKDVANLPHLLADLGPLLGLPAEKRLHALQL